MSDNIKLTPEVILTKKILYLIKINGEEKIIVNEEDEAKLVMDSIADKEVKRLENEWTKVFRRDQPDGLKISIATQNLGIAFNGFVCTNTRIECTKVPCAQLLKGRLERTVNTEKINSMITPELLSKLKERREKFVEDISDEFDYLDKVRLFRRNSAPDEPITPIHSPVEKQVFPNFKYPTTTEFMEAIYKQRFDNKNDVE